MIKWLSTEWFETTLAMAADQPERPGLSARMQYELLGGPEGDVSYFRVVENGRVVANGSGRVDDPEVILTMSWDDGKAMQQGTLDSNVAFMQGRMKVAGSMGTMMALLPVTNTAEFRALRQRIAAITEF